MPLLRAWRKPKPKVEPWDYEAVVAVRAIGPSALWVKFADGLEHELELGRIMVGPGSKAIFNADQFAQVFIDAGTATWPNGMTIAPETLYWAKYNGVSLLRESPAAVQAAEPMSTAQDRKA